jgi:hypothetical protein
MSTTTTRPSVRLARPAASERRVAWAHLDRAGAAAAALGAALVAAGVCLPWISYYGGLFSLSAVGSTNGTWLLVAAGLATVLTLAMTFRPRGAHRWASALLGSAVVLFTLHLIATVRTDLSGADAMIVPRQGPGLYVVLAGGLVMCAALVLPRHVRTPARRSEPGIARDAFGALRSRLVALTWQRSLQIALAGIWLVAAVLQAQPYMFSRAFATSTLAGSATGSPAMISMAVGHLARIVAAHPLLWNELFAGVQLTIAVLIARKSSVRIGLGISVLWGLGVWALGESFGSVFTAGATPLTGAPGPALLYVIAAVLAWPPRAAQTSDGTPLPAPWWRQERFRRVMGVAMTSLLALESWPSPSRVGAIVSMLRKMAASQPSLIAGFDRKAASIFAGHGELLLAGAAASLIASSICLLLGGRFRRPALVLLLGFAVVLFLLQNFGGVASGTATDVGTGPILALVALALWPTQLEAAVAPRLTTRTTPLVLTARRAPSAP